MVSEPFKYYKVRIDVPEGQNIVLGMSHFIKTVEDLYETLVSSSPTLKFGIAFCEASQQRLIRSDGNDAELVEKAEQTAFDIGCGHSFGVFLGEGFPINVLQRIKNVEEVVRVFCATANPIEILVAETSLGRAVLGVVDGYTPLGIETDEDKEVRQKFLRKIGYKR